MSNLALVFIGGLCGLLISMLGNYFILPRVLKSQGKKIPTSYNVPILGLDKQKIANLTKNAYRIQMPIVFTIAGAYGAVQVFGGVE
jgi:hypothetical protein